MNNSQSNSSSKLASSVLIRIQLIAAGVFLVFLIIHLSNTMLAVFGVDSYNIFQQYAELFYQFPLVEISLLILPLVVHAGIGLLLLWRKKKLGRMISKKSKMA